MRLPIRFSAVFALAAAAFLAVPAFCQPPAGSGASLSQAIREARVRAKARFEAAGDSAAGAVLRVNQPLDLVVELSWKGGSDVMGSASLESLDLSGAELGEDAGRAPWNADASKASKGEDKGSWLVEWRFPVEAAKPGLVEASDLRVAYRLAGHENAPQSIEAKDASAAIEPEPSRWLAGLLKLLGALIGLAGLGFGGWKAWRAMPEGGFGLGLAPAGSNPFASSDDPTPFERVHAELATCEMKARVEDFDGFFRKFHPLLYRFAAATEGEQVKEMGAEEIAALLDRPGYDRKIARSLAAMLETCESYADGEPAPPVEACLAMSEQLRRFANQFARRPPARRPPEQAAPSRPGFGGLDDHESGPDIF